MPLIIALLKNLTNSFDLSFYVMGAIMVLSGISGLPLRRINKYELKKRINEPKNVELEPMVKD